MDEEYEVLMDKVVGACAMKSTIDDDDVPCSGFLAVVLGYTHLHFYVWSSVVLLPRPSSAFVYGILSPAFWAYGG
ncbi:unnamed protein product [Lathyrus oleraceus]